MAGALTKRRFTADEYQQMGRAGILSQDDRVELMDGEVVTLTPIGPRHNAAVNRANRAITSAAGDKAIVQVQGSVRLDLFHEPEPDIVLLKPREDFYASRLPEPADMLLVVEIAESSIEYDRDVKAGVYAAAGVSEYWLADLGSDSVGCYTDANAGVYRTFRECRRGQSIAPRLMPRCVIPVDALLAD